MPSDRVVALQACTMPERVEAIEQLGALLCAVQAELVDVVTASDLERDWLRDGATGIDAWLMMLLHVSAGTAKEWARVGAALQDLPAIREVFSSGELAWDQAAPATVYATAATDATLAADLPGHTAHQIQVLARDHRVRTRRDAQRTNAQKAFQWRKHTDHDGYRYSGFLPAEEGARLNATLEREAHRIGPDAETGQWAPLPQRAAGALVALADQGMADDADPEGVRVVVHADAEIIDGKVDGNGTIGDLSVPRDSIRTVGIVRVSQAVPRWLRRRIALRDGCCRFPGCERPIRHRHHLRHWRQGGPTDANNLIGLCWWHHHLVHEGGWTIEGNPEGEVVFRSEWGRELRSKPNPLRSHVRRHASGVAHRDLGDSAPAA